MHHDLFFAFFFCHFLLIFALSVAIPRAGLIRFLAPCLLEFEAWQSESLIPYVGDALQASSDGIKDQWGRSVSPGHHPAYRLKTGKLLRKAYSTVRLMHLNGLRLIQWNPFK